ncbi:MAG: hypothetical protein ACJ74G_24330 [Blastocatellia bacterium]
MRTDKEPPAIVDDMEAEELALIASGQMTPPRKRKLPEDFWKMGPRLSITKKLYEKLTASQGYQVSLGYDKPELPD